MSSSTGAADENATQKFFIDHWKKEQFSMCL